MTFPSGIHARPTGKLFFRKTIRGTKYEFSFGHDSAARAECELALFYRDPDAYMEDRAAHRRASIVVSEAVELHLDWSRKVKRTSDRYRIGLGRTLRRLVASGPARLSSWRRAHVEAYLADRTAGASTIATDLKQIKAFFSWCLGQRLLSSSPAAGVVGPKALAGKTDRRRVVSLDSLLRLRFTVAGARDRVLALWATGLRVSELERVQLVDIDIAGKRLHVRCDASGPTKGKRARDVPIADETTGRLLLRVVQGGPCPENVAADLGRAIAEAGIERFTPGALRHSRITAWVDAGIPLPTVQRWAGHASIETTMNYCHVAPTAPPAAFEGVI